nr:hypothetical protein GCM10025699_75970 [Microbacterium flavescens]
MIVDEGEDHGRVDVVLPGVPREDREVRAVVGPRLLGRNRQRGSADEAHEGEHQQAGGDDPARAVAVGASTREERDGEAEEARDRDRADETAHRDDMQEGRLVHRPEGRAHPDRQHADDRDGGEEPRNTLWRVRDTIAA